MIDTQVDPLVNQTFEPLVDHGLTANLFHPFLADVLRAALHPTGIADDELWSLNVYSDVFPSEECYKAHAGPSQRARTTSDVYVPLSHPFIERLIGSFVEDNKSSIVLNRFAVCQYHQITALI